MFVRVACPVGGLLAWSGGLARGTLEIMGRLGDLTGIRFGALVVVSRAVNRVRPDGRLESQWFCDCDCGRSRVVRAVHLSTGRVVSCGDRSVHRRGAGGLTYAAVHQRLEHARGKASEHHCADCLSAPAEQWSYEGGDGDELRTPTGLRFTSNLWAYTPRCRACHEQLDAAHRRGDHSRTTVLF